MKVPLLDLRLQNKALERELSAAFQRVFQSGHFILGPEVEAFENSVANLTGARHAIGVSSGTDAILLALMALGIGPGDEVICPSFTFFATAGCVARVGAKPVFADSCLADFNLDLNDVAGRVSPRTRAIILVHLFGHMADMDAILKFAQDRGLAVIEDAAQSLGAASGGRNAGTAGQFGTFSFFPSKNLGGFGDAGMLVTNDDTLAAKARLLRVHGAQRRYFYESIGGNFRIDALQAALLNVKLPHLARYSEARAANAARYNQLLHAANPQRIALIKPSERPGNRHIWNQYTLRIVPGPAWEGAESPRDGLKAWLAAREIGCEVYYPLPLHRQQCFAAAQPLELPVCERLSQEVLSIPIFPELTQEQQETVIAAINAFLAV